MSHDNKYQLEQINRHLVGAKILNSVEEEGDEYTACVGFSILTRAGKILHVWIQQDAEGNGPGWLAIEDQEGKAVR
jgi:hypothetical protein